MSNIDFTELRDEVIEMWENEGLSVYQYDNNGFNEPGATYWEATFVEPYDSILSSPLDCIRELGFESISEYIRSKNAEN